MNSPFDPFKLMGQFQSFMQSPAAFAAQRLNLPQNIQNDPDAIIQHMMNTGMMSQTQYDQLRQTASRMMSNSNFARMMRR